MGILYSQLMEDPVNYGSNKKITDGERLASKKIENAQTVEEVADIISDALVNELMEQIHF